MSIISMDYPQRKSNSNTFQHATQDVRKTICTSRTSRDGEDQTESPTDTILARIKHQH